LGSYHALGRPSGLAPHGEEGGLLKKREWCIQFFDFGEWDEYVGKRFQHKPEAAAECNRMNKEMDNEARKACYLGHRFRVRACGEED